MDYRINQRVCKVRWRRGQPYIYVGKVTRTTKTTHYVDNEKKRGFAWSTSWQDAIQLEYKYLLTEWGMYEMTFWKKDVDWTIEDSVRCICRLRRLERRLRKRGKPTA